MNILSIYIFYHMLLIFHLIRISLIVCACDFPMEKNASVHILMSHAVTISIPPPMHAPCMLAVTGLRHRSRAVTASCIASISRRRNPNSRRLIPGGRCRCRSSSGPRRSTRRSPSPPGCDPVHAELWS